MKMPVAISDKVLYNIYAYVEFEKCCLNQMVLWF